MVSSWLSPKSHQGNECLDSKKLRKAVFDLILTLKSSLAKGIRSLLLGDNLLG